MKILHVSLGLPPFRTGGLNRYCADLMAQQAVQGDEVMLLCPGPFRPGGKTKIVRSREKRFPVYQVVNPLPVALTNGVARPSRYMTACKTPGSYRDFLSCQVPDVIHVHSIQGIHREFFQIAQAMGIRMVFTTHDYYPICPACVLLNETGSLCDAPGGARCARCNQGRGLSPMQELVMQSRSYEALKYSPLIKRLRARAVRGKAPQPVPQGRSPQRETPPAELCRAYAGLLAYYHDILSCMSMIHSNSWVSYRVYQQHFPGIPNQMLGITHAGIHPTPHTFRRDVLRVGYMGGLVHFKGLPILLQAFEILQKQGIPCELWLYGADYSAAAEISPAIHNCGRFDAAREDAVWASFDVLAVPSQGWESFGFVVQEALAHGLCAVCSDLVGAQHLLPEDAVFPHQSAQALAQALRAARTAPGIAPEEYAMDLHADRLKGCCYQKDRTE